MKNIAIIYPNQLYEVKYLPYEIKKMDMIILVEDTIFFEDSEKELKFNMLKLIFQRASMKYYQSYLKKYTNKIAYLDFDNATNHDNPFKYIHNRIKSDVTLHIIDTCDRLLDFRIRNIQKNINNRFKIHDSPGFLLSKSDLDNYVSTISKKKSGSKTVKKM